MTPITWAVEWSSDTQLTTSGAWDRSPSIVQVADGSIWVVWQSDRIGVQYDLYYKTSPDYGLTWSSDTMLTTHSTSDIKPSIVQVADGSIWVVWSSYRTGDYELFYKTSSDYGLHWSSDIRLTTDPDFDERPSIVQAVDGSIWVVWQSDRGGGAQYDLYYKTSPDYGLTWSPDTRLTTNSNEDEDPSITNTDEGKMWVTWESDRTLDYEIFYTISDLIPVHDVAITDVTPSSTDVTGGQTVTINVTAENQGTQDETFDVSCYANSNLIGTQTITLANGTSTTLTFDWTTPFPTATYVISATASTVIGETLPNTVDNTFNDGTVSVTRPPIQGDVDGDGDVDLDDLYYVLVGYGMTIEDAMATYGVPPGTDIDGDGTIDLDDLYYVLIDYGES